MKKLINDIKQYFNESRTLIIVAVASIAVLVFSINFMFSMPRTFFFATGLGLGAIARHFWSPIQAAGKDMVRDIPLTSKFIDRNDDAHLNI